MTPTTDERTARALRAELVRSGHRPADLADAVGLSPWALRRRLRAEVPFTAAEVVAAARYLGVPVTALLPDEDAAA